MEYNNKNGIVSDVGVEHITIDGTEYCEFRDVEKP